MNPEQRGTKAAGHYRMQIAAGASASVRARFHRDTLKGGFRDFDNMLRRRAHEADLFYAELQKDMTSKFPNIVVQNT